jgi:hypothetical protein
VSANAWLLWFALQTLVLLGVLGIAMLGVTGHLTRSHRGAVSSGRPGRATRESHPRRFHLHIGHQPGR